MKKRMLALALTVAMLLSLFPGQVFATEIETEHTEHNFVEMQPETVTPMDDLNEVSEEETPTAVTDDRKDHGTVVPHEPMDGVSVPDGEAEPQGGVGQLEAMPMAATYHQDHCLFSYDCNEGKAFGAECSHYKEYQLITGAWFENIVGGNVPDGVTYSRENTRIYLGTDRTLSLVLMEDIDLSDIRYLDNIVIKQNDGQKNHAVNICLNGHTLDLGGGQLLVGASGDLRISDCKGPGKVTSSCDGSTVHVYGDGILRMYDGLVKNTSTSTTETNLCGVYSVGTVYYFDGRTEGKHDGLFAAKGEVNVYDGEFVGESGIYIKTNNDTGSTVLNIKGSPNFITTKQDIKLNTGCMISLIGTLTLPEGDPITVTFTEALGVGQKRQLTQSWSNYGMTVEQIPFVSTQGYAVVPVTENGVTELYMVIPTVETNADGHGSLTMTSPTADALTVGSTVTLKAAPAEGYRFGTVSAYYMVGETKVNVDLTNHGNGTYTFTMPNADVVNCYATFVKLHSHAITENGSTVTFATELTSENFNGNLENGKSYVLMGPISYSGDIAVSGTVNLCLNGYTLDLGTSRISLDAGDVLKICDCNSSGNGAGKITSAYTSASNASSSVTSGSTIYNSSGELHLYGGTVDNTATKGSGISSNSTTHIFGGRVEGDKFGIYAASGNLNISGGTITARTNNPSAIRGNDAAITITGGTITVDTYRAIEMNGGSLTVDGENVQINSKTSSAVYVNHSNAIVTLKKGALTGKYGVYNFKGTTTVSDTISITGNEAGIYIYGGTLKLSGAPEIRGSTADFRIKGNKTTGLTDNRITITGPITVTEPYSVEITEVAPTDDKPIPFTTGWNTHHSGATVYPFQSHETDYKIAELRDSAEAPYELYLVAAHVHCKYGHNCPDIQGGEACGHDKITFDKGLSADQFLAFVQGGTFPAGNYFLTEPVVYSSEFHIKEDVHLCLNDYKIETNNYIKCEGNSASLSVYDCKDEGELKCTRIFPSGGDSAELHLFGGTISLTPPDKSWASDVGTSGVLELDGASIQITVPDTYSTKEGFIYKVGQGGSIDLKSGVIKHNSNIPSVYFHGNGALNLQGWVQIDGGTDSPDIAFGNASRRITITGKLTPPVVAGVPDAYTVKLSKALSQTDKEYQLTIDWDKSGLSSKTLGAGNAQIPFVSTQGYAVIEKDVGNGVYELFLVLPTVETTTDRHGDLTMTAPAAADVRVGSTITLTATPNEGYLVDRVTATYKDNNGNDVSISVNSTGNGTYTFTMPNTDVVTCYATFYISHKHCLCGDGQNPNCTHEEIRFDKELTASYFSGELKAGWYVLTSDVTVTNSNTNYYTASGDVNICLNGHVLDLKSSFILLRSNINICDCSKNKSGKILISENQDNRGMFGLYLSSPVKTLSIYGGTFINTEGSIINNGCFGALNVNLYAGVFESKGTTFGRDASVTIHSENVVITSHEGYGIAYTNGSRLITLKAAPTINGALGDIYLGAGLRISIGGDLKRTDGETYRIVTETLPTVSAPYVRFTSGWTSYNGDPTIFTQNMNLTYTIGTVAADSAHGISASNELHIKGHVHYITNLDGQPETILYDKPLTQQIWNRADVSAGKRFSAGNYVLVEDIKGGELRFSGLQVDAANFCLCGHDFVSTTVFKVSSTAALSFVDCTEDQNQVGEIHCQYFLDDVFGDIYMENIKLTTTGNGYADVVGIGVCGNLFMKDCQVTTNGKTYGIANCNVADGQGVVFIGGSITTSRTHSFEIDSFETFVLGGSPSVTSAADHDIYLYTSQENITISFMEEYPLLPPEDQIYRVKVDKEPTAEEPRIRITTDWGKYSGLATHKDEKGNFIPAVIPFVSTQGYAVVELYCEETQQLELYLVENHEHYMAVDWENGHADNDYKHADGTAVGDEIIFGTLLTDYYMQLLSTGTDNDEEYYLLGGGSYILYDEILMNKGIKITGTVNLCLNGHTLDLGENRITFGTNGNLNICDCAGGGEITSTYYSSGIAYSHGTLNLFGGTISHPVIYDKNDKHYDNDGDQVVPATIRCNSKLNVYGGTIDSYHHAVITVNSAAEVQIFGGSIEGGEADELAHVGKAEGGYALYMSHCKSAVINGADVVIKGQGAMRISDGDVTIIRATISADTTGIHIDGGNVTVDTGAHITSRYSCLDLEKGNLYFSGSPNLTFSSTNILNAHIRLRKNQVITVNGDITGTYSVATVEIPTVDKPVRITADWPKYEANTKPFHFVSRDPAYRVVKLSNGELYLVVGEIANPLELHLWANHEVKVTKDALFGNIMSCDTPHYFFAEGKTYTVNNITVEALTGVSVDTTNYSFLAPNAGIYEGKVKVTYADENGLTDEVTVKIKVYVYDVKDSIYVMDYTHPLDMSTSLYLNDALQGANVSVEGFAKTAPAYVAEGPVLSFAEGTLAEGGKGTYGTFTARGKDVTYTTTDMLSDTETMYAILRACGAGETAGTVMGTADPFKEAELVKTIKVIPANVVYYEDTNEALVWGTEGSKISITPVGESSVGYQDGVINDEYGNDPGYAYDPGVGDDGNVGTYVGSGGTHKQIVINGAGTILQFTFTGTGFDVIGRTNASSGTIRYRVYQDNKQLYNGLVDTAYQGDIYQVPLLHKEMEYGTYTVKLEAVLEYNWDYEGEWPNYDPNLGIYLPPVKTAYLWLDGVRVYNSLAMGDEDRQYYNNDGEETARFVEIRRQIREGYAASVSFDAEGVFKVGAGSIFYLETAQKGASYTGNSTTNGQDYLVAGPNNELYFNSAKQAAVLYVKAEDANKATMLQVGIRKLNSGTFGTAGTPGVMSLGTNNSKEILVDNTKASIGYSEQYYTVDLSKCETEEIGGEIYCRVVISAMGGAPFAMTNLKYSNLTFAKIPEVKNTVDFTESGTEVLYSMPDLPRLARQLRMAYDMLPEDEFEATDEALSFVGVSLNLHSSIAMNIYVDEAVLEGYEDPYVLVEKQHGDRVVYETAKAVPTGKKMIGSMSCLNFYYPGITSKEMSATVRLTLYAWKDGVLTRGVSIDYGILTYAKNTLSKNNDPTLRTMLVDMLNYGAEAQIYWDYHTEFLANSTLTEAEKALATVQEPVLVDGTIEDDPSIPGSGSYPYSIIGASLLLKDKVEINYFLNAGEGDFSGKKLVITYVDASGKDVKREIPAQAFTHVADTYYKVTFDGLNAKDMRVPVTCWIADEKEERLSNALTYSIESYAASYSGEGTLRELLMDMMRYGDAAHAYFTTRKNG